MIRKTLLLLLFSCCYGYSSFSQSAIGQAFDKPKMDSLMDVLIQNNKAMISIAITRDGKLLYSRAVGYNEITTAAQRPATAESRYRMGSITKVFTGSMIFQLIEEGKLALNTPLAKFFPLLPNAAKITIAQMLNHSSGLYNFTNDTSFTKKVSTKVSQQELLSRFENAKSAFEPGAKHEYSNTNFVLLGFIIEKLDKKTYAEALKARITNKIGLKDTYYGGKISPSNKEAYSYNWKGSWQPDTETDMSIPGGAGALVSTPADLNTFMEALFTGKLIKENSLTQMKTMKDGFGMAMFSYPFYERTAYGHNGGIDGFRSQALYYPQDKLAYSYIANGVNINLNDVAIAVLSIAFNKPYKIPDFKVLLLKTEELDPYLGTYSSAQLPLKITVTKTDATLMAQATGQSAFALEAVQKNEFKFSPANVVLIFDPENKQMTLKQNGAVFIMKRE